MYIQKTPHLQGISHKIGILHYIGGELYAIISRKLEKECKKKVQIEPYFNKYKRKLQSIVII